MSTDNEFLDRIHNFLYTCRLSLDGELCGIGAEIVFSFEKGDCEWKELYIYLVNSSPHLLTLYTEFEKPKLSSEKFKVLQNLNFDIPIETFQCTVLMKKFSEYAVKYNIKFLISDYFSFDTLPLLFHAMSEKKYTSMFKNAIDPEEEILKIIGKNFTQEYITWEEVLDRQSFIKGTIWPIQNSIILIYNKIHESIQHEKLINICRKMNKNANKKEYAKRKNVKVKGAASKKKKLEEEYPDEF